MKKALVTIALSCSIALAATAALWAGDQPGCGNCQKVAQNTAQAAEKKCICESCSEGKKNAACTCGCNTSKGCDLKGCDSCAKKEKSQQKPCCDQKKAK
ncbi:hypothetical protein LPW11_06210 [Geomonas sp. RF6]|uniref:hypothetical protein n=1 Tax=Geomonas sp. RF6 TaxID=2897342 RepID=UPI001E4CF33E|nr:hypothetical protein [Geomonas sp. RF6]UFS71783.1 hypothetical protein LPW11_06210 [Geomonas sp. RF6]